MQRLRHQADRARSFARQDRGAARSCHRTMSQTLDRSTILTPESLAELRHDLRTPVNHIIGYAEMLAEDASGPALATRRSHLEEALAAARDILAHINSALGLNNGSVTSADVAGLYDALREPRHRIVSAVTTVLRAPDAEPDASLADDVGRILAAAGRLAGPAAAAPTSDDAAHDSPEVEGASGAESGNGNGAPR